MSDFSISPCPVGFFCNEAIIEATACPDNGTYRNSTGAGTIEECFACPRGFVCPFNATIAPIACLNGTFCPPGSVEPRKCQPGFYCPRSMYELPCPAGFYCPLGSSYHLQCPMGYYCDPTLLNGTGGVIKPSLCPKGNVDFQLNQSISLLHSYPLTSFKHLLITGLWKIMPTIANISRGMAF